MISFLFITSITENLASDEVLYTDEGDLLPKTKAKRNRVMELLREENVPIELFARISTLLSRSSWP